MKLRLMFLLTCAVFGLLGLGAASGAYAQAGTASSTLGDSMTITVGTEISGGTLYGFGPGFGSISTPKTSDGYTIVSFYDNFHLGSKVGGYYSTSLVVSGFSSDPGAAWIYSAVVGNVSYSNANLHGYVYSNGQGTWTWNTGSSFLQSSPVAVTVTHFPGVADLNVRFKVLGVDYAPPGAKSTVNYSNSTMRGSATSDEETFTDSTTVGVKVTAGLGFFGLAHGTATAGVSQTYSQQSDGTSSVALNTTAGNSDIIDGPASSAAGVDHDYDIIWVWVNPMVTLAVGPGAIVNTGFAYNAEDDAGEMEVIPLYVTWLKNPATIPPAVAARLARSWDTSGVGGLTTVDYELILTADPFEVNSSYNPNTDAAHRFDLQEGQTFSYEPPPAGGQPITQTLTLSTTTTSTAGQSATNTSSTTFSLDFNSGVSVVVDVSTAISISNTYTTTDKWNSTTTAGSTQTASLSLVGPQTSDMYTGPTTIQVWRDNIYGSFMFYPVD